MDLRTFIKTALLDIVNAVQDAQKESADGLIVPNGIPVNNQTLRFGISEIQTVAFEIMVQVNEAKGSEGKLGVVNSIIGAGISGRSSTDSRQANVIKFNVPVKLPVAGDSEQLTD